MEWEWWAATIIEFAREICLIKNEKLDRVIMWGGGEGEKEEEERRRDTIVFVFSFAAAPNSLNACMADCSPQRYFSFSEWF